MNSYIFLALIIHAECEWVEISQQHYKKPIRLTHNHPLLATDGKPETIRPHVQTTKANDEAIKTKHDRPIIDATRKVTDDDKVTKRNRIYINHTLTANNWDIDSVKKVPSDVNVKVKSDTRINEEHDAVRKPVVIDVEQHETKSKGEIIIIRRPDVNDMKNGSTKPDKPLVHRTTVAGHVVRVRPTNNKLSTNKPNPMDEYRGPIEVLNLSDLEYTSAEGTLNTNSDTGIENTVKLKQSTNSAKRYQQSSNSETSKDYESTTKYSLVFKDVTSMRRVDIIPSTKPTPIKEYDEIDRRKNKPSSTLPELYTEKHSDNRKVGITPYQFPNLGQVKRVYVEGNTTKIVPKNNEITKMSSKDVFTRKSNETENQIRVDDTTKTTTEKIKSFPVRSKPKYKNRIQLNQVPTVPIEELIVGEEKHFDIKVHKVASIGTVKRISNPIAGKNKHDTKPTAAIQTNDEVAVVDEDSNIHKDVNKNYYFTSSTEQIPILTTAKIKSKESTLTGRPEINVEIEKYNSNPYKPIRIREHIPEFITKNDKLGEIESESTSTSNLEKRKTTVESNNRAIEERQENQDNSSVDSKSNSQKNKNINDQNTEKEELLSNDKKNSAMESLIKFLKTVTEIITKNTRRGVHGKMRYLEDLRDTIMANIEERLEAEFPDDDAPARGSRRARSAEPRGHVEFPSSEGALMTISFLTFAVFLIKLVLQVIQAYKNKTMMMMPTVVAAVGRAYSERSNRV